MRHHLLRSMPGRVYPELSEMKSTRFGRWYRSSEEFLHIASNDAHILAQKRFFFGHFVYALIDHLPETFQSAVFIREPIRRTLSIINHRRKLNVKKFGNMTISEFLNCDNIVCRQICDYQTKVFAIDDICITPNDPYVITERGFQRALDNLRQCSFIGITENMGASLRLFENVTNSILSGTMPVMNTSKTHSLPKLASIVLKRKLSNPLIDEYHTLSKSTVENIVQKIRYDILLYDEAVKLHKQQLQRFNIC